MKVVTVLECRTDLCMQLRRRTATFDLLFRQLAVGINISVPPSNSRNARCTTTSVVEMLMYALLCPQERARQLS